MANKKVNIKLTKLDIAIYLYNDTLQGIVQNEIKIDFWNMKEAMAKPSTKEKSDAIAKIVLFEKELAEARLLLAMTEKGINKYGTKGK